MNMQIRTAVSVLALVVAASAWGAQGVGAEASSPQAATSGAPAGLSSNGSSPAQSANNPILKMKAGEISGREVYNTEGKELGKVDMIGRDRTTGDLSAIISVGGFLGFGGSKVAIPLDQLALQEDKLTLATAMSKKELRRQASNYQSKRYEAVAEDTTLSQVAPPAGGTAATGTGSTTQGSTTQGMQGSTAPRAPSSGGNISFQQLDTNQDGYIERNEAAGDPALLNRWQQADRNHDGRIDPSEFSAFEQASGNEPRPSGDNMRERQRARPMSPSQPRQQQ